MFTWSTSPLSCSQTARRRGPTTAADCTSARFQSSTRSGVPKHNGTETSPPPKSSTDARTDDAVDSTWKERTYEASRPVGRKSVIFTGEAINDPYGPSVGQYEVRSLNRKLSGKRVYNARTDPPGFP